VQAAVLLRLLAQLVLSWGSFLKFHFPAFLPGEFLHLRKSTDNLIEVKGGYIFKTRQVLKYFPELMS